MNSETIEEIHSWLNAFLWPEPDGKQRAKRARILASATSLFVRFGYRKTSIDEVARASGVAKGTVYLYYRNKAELVLHAIALEKSGYLERLEPLLAAEVDASERLRALIALGLVGMQEMPLLSSLSGGDHELGLALGEVDASVLARVDGWRAEFMMGLLDEATNWTLSRQALLERAEVLIDVISGVVLSGALGQKGEGLEQYAWTLAGILVGGVATTSAPLDVPATWLQLVGASKDAPIATANIAAVNKEAAL
jgi:AcrR family transcriptional regulator